MTMKNVLEQPELQPRIPSYMTDKNIEAVDMAEMSFEKVKAKNPNLSFRWINWKNNEGERYHKAIYQGYRPAKILDCEVIGSAPNAEGVFKMYDVILMCIDRKIYEGKLKKNALDSIRQVDGVGAAKNIEEQLAAQPGAANYVNRGKLSAYESSKSEKDKLVGSD